VAAAELGKGLARRHRSIDRVELVAAFDEAWGRGRVEISAQRDHQNVGVERFSLRGQAFGDRIDAPKLTMRMAAP
jgi:hypothetical protein